VLAGLTLAALLAAPSGAPPPALAAALEAAPAGGARATAATAALLGAPYVFSALGEGEGPDPDPRFRLDAFDCLGFVETAVALGSSRSLGEAARALDDIRYGGPPALGWRNHEVQSQWIPENLAKGWIAELSQELAGARAIPVAKEFTAEGWRRIHAAGRGIRGLPPAREPVGRFELWAVAPGDLAEVGPRIPDGALVFVVRADAPDRATRISHAGLVVVDPAGERRVRHATSTVGVRRVIEEPLTRFVRREARAHPGWPLVGLSFFRVPDSSDRVAHLAAPATSP
jgi:hypothetical protein